MIEEILWACVNSEQTIKLKKEQGGVRYDHARMFVYEGRNGRIMSHTKRIYNNPNIKKAQRYNVDDNKPHLIIGIPLTKRSWLCMGKCPMCRDKNKEPRLIRKRLREQFRIELKEFGI